MLQPFAVWNTLPDNGSCPHWTRHALGEDKHLGRDGLHDLQHKPTHLLSEGMTSTSRLQECYAVSFVFNVNRLVEYSPMGYITTFSKGHEILQVQLMPHATSSGVPHQPPKQHSGAFENLHIANKIHL